MDMIWYHLLVQGVVGDAYPMCDMLHGGRAGGIFPAVDLRRADRRYAGPEELLPCLSRNSGIRTHIDWVVHLGRLLERPSATHEIPYELGIF